MDYMQRALALAAKALGTTSPNPAVGAVLVNHGRIVGQGYTQPPPGPHAEVVALKRAGERARGATLYVTLEPCCHHGLTPPCTTAIIDAAIAQVHIAALDPDPKVNGRGKAALEASGLSVRLGEREEEARRLNEAYFKQRTTGLPFVIAKFAASLDGRIAAASGDSRWIASPQARQWAHRLRAQVDAIMVGSGTIVSDDPLLTARPEPVEGARPGGKEAQRPWPGRPWPGRQPLRIVVDTRGRTPPMAQVLAGPAPTLIATGDQANPAWRSALQAAGAEVLVFPSDGDHVDLLALLRTLGQRDIVSLLVEGGGTLLGSCFDKGLVDKVHAVIAPIIIGAADAPAAVAGRGAYRIAEALHLREVSVERLGDDILVTGYPQYPAAAA